MVRGKWLLLSGVIILASIGAGALSVLRRGPAKEKRAAAEQPQQQLVEINLSGTIQAPNLVPVPAPIEGVLQSVFVEPGEQVFEGQLLARIENQELDLARISASERLEQMRSRMNNMESMLIAGRLEASRASADASRARQEFDRAEKLFLRQQLLYREGATPRLQYEKAQRDYEAARAENANLQEVARHVEERMASLASEIEAVKKTLEERNREMEAAEAALQETDVLSPVDGVFLSSRAKAGDEVHRNMEALFQVAVDLSLLEVVLEPDPAALGRIRPGQPAEVHIAEIPNEAIPGAVKSVTGSEVVVEFTNPGAIVKPGLSAQVKIKLT